MRNAKESFSYRRSLRLRGFDYRQRGVYFVTICTYKGRKLFGAIVDGGMELSPLGEIAREELRHISQARSNVELDRYVIMPNHLHGLLVITDRLEHDFGQSAKTTHAKNPPGFPAGSLGAVISHYKAAVSRRAWSGLIERDQPIWQRNYYDHIVRNESSLNVIRRYILENPARWPKDSLYAE